MRTQKELFEEWKLNCEVLKGAGNVIQNDLENATNDELFDLYLDFDHIYIQAQVELDVTYQAIKQFLRTEMSKKI